MFNIARFSEQFMILFRQNKIRHGLILVIFIGIQLFSFLNNFTGNNRDPESYYNMGVIITFILCIIACQDVFNKLRNTPSGIQYLMTPATILEKYSAAWLYSSLFIVIAAQLTYLGVQFIGISLGNLITGMNETFGFPEWKKVLSIFQAALFVHAIFFFGSLLFRKNPIVKTIGSYLAIVFFITIAFAWYAKHYLVYSTLLNSNSLININMGGSFGSSINGMPIHHFLEINGINIKWILASIALLLWGGSYLLLNKKQI